mgnify:CR=1 FL=1
MWGTVQIKKKRGWGDPQPWGQQGGQQGEAVGCGAGRAGGRGDRRAGTEQDEPG